ncbi:MAG: PH domain-containing protein [Tepidisphaeraceae bacterium]
MAAPDAPMSEGDWHAYQAHWLAYASAFEPRRLHWASVPLDVSRVVRELAFLLVIVIVARLSGMGRGGYTLEFIITAMGFLRVVGAVWRYLSTSYHLTPESLAVTTGAIFNRSRVVPLASVQNVNLKQGVLHRLFRVAEVQVETATGGQHAEILLRVVSLAEAEWLRATLVRTDAPAWPAMGGAAAASHAAEGSVVYRASVGRLIIAGATGNRALQVVAGLFGVAIFVLNEVGEPGVLMHGRSLIRRVGWLSPTNIAIVVGGLLVAGWLASMALTVVGKFGFTLEHDGDRFRRAFGLFTRQVSSFRARRVQVLHVEASPVQRWLGLCRVKVDTAGAFGEEGRGSDATSEVCPILPRRDASRVIREVLGLRDLEAVDWQRVSRKAIGRAWTRSTLLLGIVVGGAGFYQHAWWWGLLAIPVLTATYALLRYRALGFAVVEGFVVVRQGVWLRRWQVIPKRKVQASVVVRSPIQRLLGLATFRILTARHVMYGAIDVPDLESGQALRIQGAVHDFPNEEGVRFDSERLPDRS